MSALSLDLLSSIIGDIYQCAVDASRWTTTLARMTDAIGTACTTIHIVNKETLTAKTLAHSPWDFEHIMTLNENYGLRGIFGLRQIISGQMDAPRSAMTHRSDVSYAKSNFYKSWAQPQGLGDSCRMKFAENDEQVCVIGTIAQGEHGAISEDKQRFMALLSPHLRRASMAGGLFGRTVEIGKHYQAALEVLGTPVLLLNTDRRVVYHNIASDRFLRDQTTLTIQNGVLSINCLHFDQALNAVFKSALVVKRDNQQHNKLHKSIVPFYGKTDQDRYKKAMVATLVPLDGMTESSATVAIFISKAGTTLPPPEATIAQLFDLTPGEARVMLRIGKGQCVKTAAQDLGLSANTIKSHLASIYFKTGIVRQSEVVRLLSDISAPLMVNLENSKPESEAPQMCA